MSHLCAFGKTSGKLERDCARPVAIDGFLTDHLIPTSCGNMSASQFDSFFKNLLCAVTDSFPIVFYNALVGCHWCLLLLLCVTGCVACDPRTLSPMCPATLGKLTLDHSIGMSLCLVDDAITGIHTYMHDGICRRPTEEKPSFHFVKTCYIASFGTGLIHALC